MDDLFRFVIARPAVLPARDDVIALSAPVLSDTGSLEQTRAVAADVLASPQAVQQVSDLVHGELALAAHELAAGRPSVDSQDVQTLVEQTDHQTVSSLVGSPTFQQDEERLALTLVAEKVVSGGSGRDVATLAEAMRGYDLLRAATLGLDQIRLRSLVMPPLPSDVVSPSSPATGSIGTAPAATTDDPEPAPAGTSSPGDRPSASIGTAAAAASAVQAAVAARTTAIDSALTSLRGLRALDFAPAQQVTAAVAPSTGATTPASDEEGGGSSAMQVAVPWLLSPAASLKLAPEVQATLAGLDLDPTTTALPTVIDTLQKARSGLDLLPDHPRVLDHDVLRRFGSDFLARPPASALVGRPSAAMPQGKGAVRAAGVGDLLVVKQQVVRYEAGEVAHVESVIRSESLTRQTRRLDRTETTSWHESESSSSEEQESSRSDRFSLARETNQTLRHDLDLSAGLTVNAKYGPLVEVSANVETASRSSRSESTRHASEFSKDVVARSVNRITDRVLDRRSTSSLNEFEEQYSHTFDNTDGTDHVRGVYRWVDKVVQAQVFNYGRRMLFDLTVPEPGTALLVAQGADGSPTATITRPAAFTLTADQLDEQNYLSWAQRYDVVGVEPPPEPFRTVSTSFDAIVASKPHESSGSKELTVEDGYRAKYALVQTTYTWVGSQRSWFLLIGSATVNCTDSRSYVDLSGEVGSIPIAYHATGMRGLAATVEVFCERTERAWRSWQLATHAAITQGYLAKMQDYEARLADAAVVAGVGVQGRNPAWNAQIIRTELRKQCLSLLTAQHFDAFGALEMTTTGHPQVALNRVAEQMSYVRFFEQAFEWEHLSHHFYPYFWGWKPAWSHKMLLDDVDGEMAQFLRAGAARVVLPVRPGFESAVAHFLETGRVWTGGQPPEITDPQYVPILTEIRESTGAAGSEVAQGDPWLVRIPTTLTVLSDGDVLPSWHQVDGEWIPVG